MSKIPTSHEIIEKTSGSGHFRIAYHDGETFRVCLLCKAEFSQTDEGFAAMDAHEFEHGMGTLYPWSELEGKHLRIVSIHNWSVCDIMKTRQVEADLYGIDDATGTIYLLNQKGPHFQEKEPNGWKWKVGIPMKQNNGQKPTLLALELLSNGLKNTAEK